MTNKPERSEVSAYGTRRGYLLNRFAWGSAGFALVYAIVSNDASRWTVVGICAGLAAVCWVLAPILDKKGRRTIEVDEKGNAKKRVL